MGILQEIIIQDNSLKVLYVSRNFIIICLLHLIIPTVTYVLQNGNFFANSPQNPQTPSSSSTQNWPQFSQRPRFIPRQHMRMNRPRSSVQNQSNGTNQV